VLSEEELARNIARTKRHLETTQNQFLARLTKSQTFFKQHHEVGLLAGSIQSF
jgi:hypothetical protein